jgi:hypothetical protein
MLSISPFLVIDDNNSRSDKKVFKSTSYTRHKVDLRVNFEVAYPYTS